MVAIEYTSPRARPMVRLLYGIAACCMPSIVAVDATAQSCPPGGPGARSGHVLAYDENIGAIVLHGGLTADAANRLPRATWAWDGSTWRCLTASGPGGRRDAHLEWDARRRRLVLFGGRTFTREGTSVFLRDTWEWDGRDEWTRVDTAGPGPRIHGGMAFDTLRGAVLVHGGGGAQDILRDTWAWDGYTWRDASLTIPAGSIGNSLSRTESSGTLLLAAERDTTPGCMTRRRAAIYRLTATGLVPAGGVPGPCFSPQAPAVAIGGGLLLFAGWNSSDASVPAETWHWSQDGWRRTDRSPPKRRGAAMAWDPRRRRAVLFGGEGVAGLLSDVWEWDGSQWTEVRTPQPSGLGAGR